MKSRLFLILALLPAVAFADTFKQTRTLELPAAGINELSMQCGPGSLAIRGVEEIDMIRVRAEIESIGAEKNELQLLAEKLVQLSLKSEYGRAVLVSEIVPQPFAGGETRINLHIELPGKMDLKIVDGSGDMYVTDITGNLAIDDGSGDIRLEGITGRITIRDDSGDIGIEEVTGSIEINDGSGEIEIQHASGDVIITDTSGGIEINDIGGNITVTDGSGGIDIYGVKKNVFIREAGSGKLEVDGVQGKVTIRDEGEERE
jgi:hypothetical protein